MIYYLITVGRGNMDLYARDIGAEFKDVTGFVLRYLEDDGVVTDHVARKPGRLTSLALAGVQPSNHFPLSFYREDPAEIHLTVEEAEHLPSSETRALLLSGNAFSRGACVKAATFCTETGHKAGLSTIMELDLRPSERLQPGGYGPSH